MVKPPNWWTYSVLAIIATGVIVIGAGKAIEDQPVGNPIPVKSATVGKPSGKLHLAPHGPLPSYIKQYTGPTNPPLQHSFTPPSPSHVPTFTQTATPKFSSTEPMPTGTPTITHTPTPTPTPTPTVTATPTPTITTTGTSPSP
jgi:hypothetical protein